MRRLQVLVRVVLLRNFFLEPSNYKDSRSQLVARFGELMRKVWNPRNYKGQVSRLSGRSGCKPGYTASRRDMPGRVTPASWDLCIVTLLLLILHYKQGNAWCTGQPARVHAGSHVRKWQALHH